MHKHQEPLITAGFKLTRRHCQMLKQLSLAHHGGNVSAYLRALIEHVQETQEEPTRA